MIEAWIGSSWGLPNSCFNGLKLLVVGESTHAAEYPVGSSPTNLLTDTVRDFVENNRNWRFYRILTTFLAGHTASRNVSDEVRHNVWKSIAFRNFVPVVAANYARQPVPAELFLKGGDAHRKFLERYQPEAVLVCGFNTWGWFNLQLNPMAPKPWEVERMTNIDNLPCACIKHPSAGFSYLRWKPALDFLSDAQHD
ncbi:hypothetical protein [Rhizobium sp. Leaf306]|uniref:hypothetical protein n=1 Tax=Rhizobium sp. Leaf306 TaxID=1736330 RepID=UPI000B18C21A|nr:hypothetical protein [Rhizobium sp. Leaf306]